MQNAVAMATAMTRSTPALRSPAPRVTRRCSELVDDEVVEFDDDLRQGSREANDTDGKGGVTFDAREGVLDRSPAEKREAIAPIGTEIELERQRLPGVVRHGERRGCRAPAGEARDRLHLDARDVFLREQNDVGSCQLRSGLASVD